MQLVSPSIGINKFLFQEITIQGNSVKVTIQFKTEGHADTVLDYL